MMRGRRGGARVVALTAVALMVTAATVALVVFDLEDAESAVEPPTLNDAESASLDIAVRRLFERTLSELRAEPGNAERWTAMSMVYEANGRLDLALPCYQRAVQMRPGEAKSWYRMALARHEAGESEAAEAAMRKSISLKDDYAPAHWRLGLWLTDRNELDAARNAFERAISIDGNDPAGRLGLARVRILSGEANKAIEELEPLTAREDSAATAEHAQVLLAMAYRAAGRTGDAAALTGSADAGVPTWTDPWAAELDAFRRTLTARLASAQALAESGQFDAAIGLYREVLADHPDHMMAMANLGRVLVEAGQSEQGFAVLGEALRIHPEYYLLHFNLAQSCEREARRKDAQAPALRERALAHLERCVQLNPIFAPAHGLKAEILARQGKLPEAIESLHEAARNDSGNPQWMYRIGSYELQRQHWSEAAAAMEQVTKLRPNHSEALAALGWARFQMNQFDEAEAALRRAATLRPDDPRIAAAIEQLRQRRGGQVNK